MGSVLTWTANGLLFAAACFLAADTANQILVATLLSPSTEASAPAATPPPPRSRTWSDRQIILTRNLFNSSTLSPTPTEVAEQVEDLEKSRLPVTLLGTFAASDPELSRATLQDREKNETLVVGVGDQIKQKALVTRIERRRVVLTENGAPRELTLDDENVGTPSVVRRAPPRPARRQVARRANTDVSLSREQIRDTIRDPSDLLSQARVLPKFEDGEMVGLQVSGIKPGSLFEEIGMQEGDLITEFNGIPISSPEESAQALQALGETDVLNVKIQKPDGSESYLSAPVND